MNLRILLSLVLLSLKSFSAFRSADITIVNNTSFAFQVKGISPSHGIISIYPPKFINPGTRVTFRAESQGVFTGSEGSIQFRIVASNFCYYQGLIDVKWNIPTSGDNSYSATAPTGISYGWNGPTDGCNVAVIYSFGSNGPLTLEPDLQLPHTLISSLKLKVKTANVHMAGTDNDVYFKIGPYSWKLTDLSDKNLFEQNQLDEFTLPLKGEVYCDDVNYISLIRKGLFNLNGSPLPSIDGDWEVEYIELIVNGTLIHKDVGLILSDAEPEFIEAVQSSKMSNPAYYYLSSISYLLGPEISKFDQEIAYQTTPLKSNGISGWIPANFNNVNVCGKVVQGPVLSSDGIMTIDLEVYRIVIDGVSYKLDWYNKKRKKFLRVEYHAQNFITPSSKTYLDQITNASIANKVVPKNGDYCEVFGIGKYDTDKGGWPELHAYNQNINGTFTSPFVIMDSSIPKELEQNVDKCLQLYYELAFDSKSFNKIRIDNIKSAIDKVGFTLDKFKYQAIRQEKLVIFSFLDDILKQLNVYFDTRESNRNKGIINPTLAEQQHQAAIMGMRDQCISLFNAYSQIRYNF